MNERRNNPEISSYSNKTEAIKDIEIEESEGKVPIPHDEAIERAKEWIEENER